MEVLAKVGLEVKIRFWYKEETSKECLMLDNIYISSVV